MSKLHYTELFYSIQGEGRYQGVPSIFLRTFGCNFRCKKFGIDKNEKIDGPNPEVKAIIENISNYKMFKELPLVKTGCDSYSSVYPEFKSFVTHSDSEAIATAINEMLPYKRWKEEHLVITGGEPLLGWQRSYPDLLSHRLMLGLKEVTFETNGTQDLSKEFGKFLTNSFNYDEITFSVSPKLSVSGEKWEDAIKPEVVREYEKIGYTYLKFVVASDEDAEEAEKAVFAYQNAGFTGPVYLMPVGGVESVYHLNNRKVAELAMKKGWRYSDRLQVPLFKNEWGT